MTVRMAMGTMGTDSAKSIVSHSFKRRRLAGRQHGQPDCMDTPEDDSALSRPRDPSFQGPARVTPANKAPRRWLILVVERRSEHL